MEHDILNGVSANDTGWGKGTCVGIFNKVQKVANQLGLADTIALIPGYFENTPELWGRNVQHIARLNLNADWYTSTAAFWTTFMITSFPVVSFNLITIRTGAAAKRLLMSSNSTTISLSV